LQAASTLSGSITTKHDEARILLTDAKMRMLIYGSAKVISDVAAFDRSGSNLKSLEGAKMFVSITSSMREDGLQQKIRKGGHNSNTF